MIQFFWLTIILSFVSISEVMKFKHIIKIGDMMKNVISHAVQQKMQQIALYIAYINFKSPLHPADLMSINIIFIQIIIK